MDGFHMSLQDVVNIVSEWHDREGVDDNHGRLISIFCAFAEFYYNAGKGDDSSLGDSNAIKIAVEAAFQLGRTVPREEFPC